MSIALKVLILEDRATDAELVLYELRHAGFAPDWVRVESQADYLAHLKPSLDLILADYSLPQFDALRALELLQASKLDIPFIIVSANIGEDIAVSAMKQGAADYLLKDRLARLGQAVKHALERKKERQEKRQTEEALRSSEERFRRYFELGLIGMAITSPAKGFLEINDQICEILGYERSELLQMNWVELTHPDDRAADVANFNQLLDGKFDGYSRDKRFIRKDGQIIDATISVKCLRRADGSVDYLVALLQDVSERKRAEAALRDSEERYRLLFDSNPHPMWVYDVETLALLAVNDAAVRHYGYAREEFLGLTILDIRPPEDIPALLNNLKSTASFSFGASGTWRHRKKDGTIIEVEISSHPLNFGGHSARLALANDITERAQIEAERLQLHTKIEKSAVEWQMTFSAIESPVLILDREGRITKMNYAARQLTGGGNAVGGRFEDLGFSTIWETAAELVEVIRETHTSDTYQAYDEASGRTWELAASLVEGLDGGYERIILVIREITRMVELQASLHRSETMSLMGSLVSGVAHEVRNPLFGISSTLDAFEARFGAAEESQRYISVLHNEVNRLNDLMKDLLEYGRPHNRQLQLGSIEELITQAMNACALLAKRAEAQVVIQVDADLPAIRMDAKRLLQVFLNLLENAIQHLPSGGVVTVEAKVAFTETRQWIVCAVKDTGPGFQENDLPRLFEPFFTRRRGGTGLGLSIVQKIVEEHGGKISAGNLAEGGAVVSLKFPVIASD